MIVCCYLINDSMTPLRLLRCFLGRLILLLLSDIRHELQTIFSPLSRLRATQSAIFYDIILNKIKRKGVSMDRLDINEDYFKLHENRLYHVFIINPESNSRFCGKKYAIIIENKNQIMFPLDENENIEKQVESYIKNFDKELEYKH